MRHTLLLSDILSSRKGGGGGGDSPIELPVLHRVSTTQTVGQPLTSPWFGQTSVDGYSGDLEYAPTVVNGTTLAGQNPGVTIRCGNDANDGTRVFLDIGGYLPREGFRMQVRAAYIDNNSEDNLRWGLCEEPFTNDSLASYPNLIYCHSSKVNHKISVYFLGDKVNDPLAWDSANTDNTVGALFGASWHIWNWEYDFSDKVKCQLYRRQDSALCHSGTIGTGYDISGLSFNGGSQSLRYFWFMNSRAFNVYCKRTEIQLVWFGSLTDSFPAYNAY